MVLTRIFILISTIFEFINYAVLTLVSILALFNKTELVTTDKELNAIANPANSGLNVKPTAKNSPAATGIPKTL